MTEDHTPEHVEVSAKQTGLGVYRLTHNGRVLGDSRGFSHNEVRAQIDAAVTEMRGYRYPYDAVAVYPETV